MRRTILAAAMPGTSPRLGMVWVVSTSGRGAGPWPFFKRTIDGLGAYGIGHR